MKSDFSTLFLHKNSFQNVLFVKMKMNDSSKRYSKFLIVYFYSKVFCVLLERFSFAFTANVKRQAAACRKSKKIILF